MIPHLNRFVRTAFDRLMPGGRCRTPQPDKPRKPGVQRKKSPLSLAGFGKICLQI